MTSESSARRGRRPWRLLLFIAGGLLVNVGVAWTCAASTDLRWVFGRTFTSSLAASEAWDTPRWPAPVPEEWGRPLIVQHSDAPGVRWDAVATGWEHPHQAVQVYRAGWPLTALRWTQWETSDSRGFARSWSTGAGPRLPFAASASRPGTASSWGWVGGWVPRQLPLIPDWPGFAVNTLAFGGVLWATAWAAGTASRSTVRARRTRRGQCIRCGYSRAGLTAAAACPECGAPA